MKGAFIMRKRRYKPETIIHIVKANLESGIAIYRLSEQYGIHRGRIQEWIEQYVAVPAYDRVVFTNQPQLLYGDYFIMKQEETEMMGAVIDFGSDEFKTWEEILVYFDRLGGQ